MIGIKHAECWIRVVNEYPKPERLGLLWEFADPLLELSVGRSYSVRNQFIFAVTQLAHQTNMRARPRWPDKLCGDDAIGFKTLAKVDSGWVHFSSFLTELGLLNDEAFTKTTKNFRHRLQHRFRLHFDIGLNPFFDRTENDQGVLYTYKVTPPLNLDVLFESSNS